MKAYVYYPQNKEDIKEIEEVVATVYAQAVVQKIKSLSQNKEEAIEIIQEVGERVHKNNITI